MPVGGTPPLPPVTDANPAARSRAYTKEAIATRKANEARAAAEKAKAESDRIAAEARAEADKIKAELAEYEKDPLAWNAKHGNPYDKLTEKAIGEHAKNTPEAQIAALRQEREEEKAAAAKAKADAEAKGKQDQIQAKVGAYIKGVVDHAAANKDTYDLLAGMEPIAAQTLIYEFSDEWAKRTGKVLSAKEACDLIQGELEAEGVKYANAPSVKKKLAPPAPPTEKFPVTDMKVKEMLDKRAAKIEKAKPRALSNANSNAPLRKENEPTEKKLNRKDALKLAAQTLREARGKT